MIFYTHVEMNRYRKHYNQAVNNFLYARGDEPFVSIADSWFEGFSLRTWRWTVVIMNKPPEKVIFSTHVEMNRNQRIVLRDWRNFLYARGDEPTVPATAPKSTSFSLRTWRWTAVIRPYSHYRWIFSTHVEMNRGGIMSNEKLENFLYARGDEPLLFRRFFDW